MGAVMVALRVQTLKIDERTSQPPAEQETSCRRQLSRLTATAVDPEMDNDQSCGSDPQAQKSLNGSLCAQEAGAGVADR